MALPFRSIWKATLISLTPDDFGLLPDSPGKSVANAGDVRRALTVTLPVRVPGGERPCAR